MHLWRPAVSGAQATSSTTGIGEHQEVYLKPYHAAEVVDAQLELTKPSSRTSVPSDDNIMRRLFSIYFLPKQHAAPFFHKDYFLKDMVIGRHRLSFTLLVNAVLAIACVSVVEPEYKVGMLISPALQPHGSKLSRVWCRVFEPIHPPLECDGIDQSQKDLDST